ncbi:MAG: PIG-L family deacetylase [Phycisphaerae bacterium]|nr:PIG-L family deacetylase [Phycisphaerae bacterium]
MTSPDEPMDVVFTSPHPDDLEISMGGTIAKLAKLGYRVAMVHSTVGEPTPRGTEERRREEAARAAEVLGATVMEILPIQNREVMDCPTNRYVLATAFRKYRPKIVVTMAGRTPLASPDHWQAELMAEASVFYSRLTKWDDRFEDTPPHTIDKLVYRQIPIGLKMVRWPTSFVMDVSDTIEQKLEAVACYESQFNPARLAMLQHWIRSAAGFEGGAAGFAFGETFCLPRALATDDLFKLVG